MIAIVHPDGREENVGNDPEGTSTKNGCSELGNQAKFTDRDLLRQGVEEQEQVLQMSDFLRRAITTVIALSSRNENGVISAGLASFKKAVLEGESIDALEASLQRLKNMAMHTETEGLPVPAAGLWDKFRVFSRKNQQKVIDGYLQEIKSIYLSIAEEFDQDLGENYASQLTLFRKDVEDSADVEHLIALKQDLLVVIQAYNQTLNEERNQITDFITEISSYLLGIERQFVHSFSQSDQCHAVNSSFNNLIELHIDDMKKSAQISSTLAEFKNLVVSRLASIRAALEEKRREEEIRQESINEEMKTLQQNVTRMKKEIDQVQEKRKALEKEVLIDQLTGAANRRAFKRRLKEELQRYQRYHHFFSMLLFDIDHFKAINDRFGHWAGDKCLKELIKRIKPILRETDFLARWGGEEFVILLAGTDLESATGVAERLRKAVENTRFIYHKQEINFTVSIGVSEVASADMSQETIFNRVDKAMYEAKRRGRNQVYRVQ